MANLHRESPGIRLHRAVMLFCVAVLLFTGVLRGAEKGSRKVVRVAYQEFNRQMIVDEQNKPFSPVSIAYGPTSQTRPFRDIIKRKLAKNNPQYSWARSFLHFQLAKCPAAVYIKRGVGCAHFAKWRCISTRSDIRDGV